MNPIKDLKRVVLKDEAQSGVIKRVDRGQITISTNKGAIITAPNADLDVRPGDRVSMADGTIVEKISSGEDKPTYQV